MNAPTRPAVHPTATHRLAAQRAPFISPSAENWHSDFKTCVTKLPAAVAGTSQCHELFADAHKAVVPHLKSRAYSRGHSTHPGDAQDPFVTVSSSISSSPSSVGPEKKKKKKTCSQSRTDFEHSRTLRSCDQAPRHCGLRPGGTARRPPVSGGYWMGWLLPSNRMV